MNPQKTRRRLLQIAAAATITTGGAVAAETPPAKKVYRTGPKPATPPMYSLGISFGNLVFLPGIISPTPGDITAQTEYVLGEIRRRLEASGSSMDKALKTTVYLADIKDFAAMNQVYLGKFGEDPPVRTTVAVAALSNNVLIEIDVIASI